MHKNRPLLSLVTLAPPLHYRSSTWLHSHSQLTDLSLARPRTKLCAGSAFCAIDRHTPDTTQSHLDATLGQRPCSLLPHSR